MDDGNLYPKYIKPEMLCNTPQNLYYSILVMTVTNEVLWQQGHNVQGNIASECAHLDVNQSELLFVYVVT